MARAVRPSQKAVRKARLAAHFSKLREDSQYFRVLEAQAEYVLFFYAGYRIRFESYYGSTVRKGGDNRFLSTEDYALMFTLADMLMKAVVEGYKTKAKERAKLKPPKEVAEKPQQLSFQLIGKA